MGLKVGWGVSVSRKRWEIDLRWLLITNRKSYVGFRLQQKSMTLKDLERRRNGRLLSVVLTSCFTLLGDDWLVKFTYINPLNWTQQYWTSWALSLTVANCDDSSTETVDKHGSTAQLGRHLSSRARIACIHRTRVCSDTAAFEDRAPPTRRRYFKP